MPGNRGLNAALALQVEQSRAEVTQDFDFAEAEQNIRELLEEIPVAPELADAISADGISLHDSNLPATDAGRLAWVMTLHDETFNILRRNYPAWMSGVFKPDQEVEEAIRPYQRDTLLQEVAYGGLGSLFTFESLLYACRLNYYPEMSGLEPHSYPAIAKIATEDLHQMFGEGIDLRDVTDRDVVEVLRAQVPSDLSQETLDARLRHLYHLAEFLAASSFAGDLVLLASIGGKRERQARQLMERYADRLFAHNPQTKVEMLNDMAGVLWRFGEGIRTDKNKRVLSRFVQLAARKHTLIGQQMLDFPNFTGLQSVYEALGYELPEEFREAKPTPIAVTAGRVAATEQVALKPDPAELAREAAAWKSQRTAYVADVGTLVAEWQVSAKQRKQPERDFSEFERALVNGYRNVAATATIPGISKEQAAVLTGLLMRLDGRAAAHDTRQTAQDLHTMLLQVSSLGTEVERLAKQQPAGKKGKGLELPAVPEIERAVDYMRGHWQGLASLLEDKWPGALREDRLQARQRLEAVLAAYEADENAAATQLAPAPHAPLSGVVELEGASE